MEIQISVIEKHPTVEGSPVITCGNDSYFLHFQFDDEWADIPNKVARFVYVRDGVLKYEDVVFIGNSVEVPVLTNIREVQVGVYASNLKTTTPAIIPCERSIRCGTAAPQVPTPSQFDQAMALINSGELRGPMGHTPEKGVDYWTEEDKEEIVQVTASLVREVEGSENYEQYLSINDDGVVSLKPEYRADDGSGNAGSKYEELPETLIIPDVVSEVAVTALEPGMIRKNRRIKSITLPKTVTEIPKNFAGGTWNLEEVSGTENITKLGHSAFTKSGIRKIYLPKLREFAEKSPGIAGFQQFGGCNFLQVADIGEVDHIPSFCFSACERLSLVKCRDDITRVGGNGFNSTKRLKSLPFLQHLTSVDQYGFYQSRVNYPWNNHPNINDISAYPKDSTYAFYNKTDFWTMPEGFTFTRTESPLKSAWHQADPSFPASDAARFQTIEHNEYTIQDWTSNCGIVAQTHICSALKDMPMTPWEYMNMANDASGGEAFEKIKSIDNPDGRDGADPFSAIEWFEWLGLKGTLYKGYTTEHVQALYEALMAGKYIYAIVIGASGFPETQHAVAFYGVTENGEVMVLDSGAYSYQVEIYEPITYMMPIQNIAASSDMGMVLDFVVFEKNEEVTE